METAAATTLVERAGATVAGIAVLNADDNDQAGHSPNRTTSTP